MDDLVEHASALLIDAHRHGRRFAACDHPPLERLGDIYRIHAAVLQALQPGTRIDTWKVIPPRDDWPPTAAPIQRGHQLASPARVSAAGMQLFGVEAEIAYRFGADLPPRASAYADEEVFAAVETLHVAIELCDTRLSDWSAASPLWRLADFQSNARLVLGEAQTEWRSVDFARQQVELSVDGALREKAIGAHPSVDPARLLPALVAHAVEHADGLRRGDVVTTGSWTGMLRTHPGARIDVRFAGIGDVQLQLDA